MGAVLMLPLQIGGTVWGLVEIFDERPRRFTRCDADAARLVSEHAGVMLECFAVAEELQHSCRQTLAALANVLEAKDDYTSYHTQEVAGLAVEVAKRLELEDGAERSVELGALLHDIGKVRVPESILGKPGPLTHEEWEVMRGHPEAGERILAPIAALADVLPLVRSSHERWDGTGYPDGLENEEIPIGARIVAVCDAFRAMIEARPYRAALDPAEALEELRRNAGTQFDPTCVEALLAVLEGPVAGDTLVLQRPA
jgi:two-component system cell cycle response regulator